MTQTAARLPHAMPAAVEGLRAQVGIGWRHPHDAQLLQRRPALDFLEVHSENFFAPGGAALAVLMQGRAHYPISLHGVGLSLGSAGALDEWHLTQLARLVKQVDPIRVSDHASFSRGQHRGALVHASDLLPLPFTPAALDVLGAHVQQVQDRLQRRFMVENISSYVRWPDAPAAPQMPEPAFLSALARRTGCALLVDVNNIYVNALNARLNGAPGDPLQHSLRWLEGISPSDVGEIHLAGHRHVRPVPGDEALGAIVIDDHASRVCPEVWQIYQHALHRFGPVPTLIEWDTEIPALDVLLDEAAHARALMSALPEART